MALFKKAKIRNFIKLYFYITILLLWVIAVIYGNKLRYTVNADKCIGCTICEQKCPVHAITMHNNKAVIDISKCTNCGICFNICPMKAIGVDTVKIASNDTIAVDSSIIDTSKILKTNSSYKYKVNTKKCVGCGLCETVCPVGAITIWKNMAIIDVQKCIGCGKCMNICPQKAIHIESKKEK